MDMREYREIIADIDRLRKKVEVMASSTEQVDQVDVNASKLAGGRGAEPREETSTSSAGHEGPSTGRGDGPPADVDEVLDVIKRRMSSRMAAESGYTLLFALLEAREGNERQSMLGCVSESDVGKVLVPDSELVTFAAAFTNPGRLKIIRALTRGSRTSRDLSAQTGLVGGQLYHHLNELIRTGFVRQDGRNCYSLTEEVGKPAYLGINLLVRTIGHARARLKLRQEADREQRGLPDDFDEDDADNL